MNKIFTAITLATITLATATAASIKVTSWPEKSFTNARVERTPTALVLRMDVNPGAFNVKSNQQAELHPAVVGGADTLWFSPVVIAGRTRYIQNNRLHTLPADVIQLHAGSTEAYAYQAIVPYEPWMDLCDLVLTGNVAGCCGNDLGPMKPDQPLASCDFRDKTLRPVMVKGFIKHIIYLLKIWTCRDVV